MKYSQVTVFNAKGENVAYSMHALRIYNCEEDINLNPRKELNGQDSLAQNTNLIFSVIIFIDPLSL